MTTVVSPTTVATKPVRLPRSAALSDTLIIAKRNILRLIRTPQLLVFSTIQPVMFVLLFRYVFGGAIPIANYRYVDYLMPGIIVQTTLFGGASTAVGLAEDINKGIVDRFRSLPMARSAVLAGRTVADLFRNVFVTALMLFVGFLVGFRIHGGVPKLILAMAIGLAFGFVFSWFFAFIGLSVRDPETAQVAGFLPIFPLTFAASTFTPVRTQPGWLQVFSRNQPLTKTVDAVRALTHGDPLGNSLWIAALWIIGLLAVFAPLAVRRYRKG